MTNLPTSTTLTGLFPKSALGALQAMAKPNTTSGYDAEFANDPVAAALKQMHDAVAGEALPDDFLRLLDEIDTKIAANKAAF